MVSNDFGGDGDWAHARKCTKDFAHTPEEGMEYALRLWKRTRRLVPQPAVWSTILALAEALLEQRDMSGDDALVIMQPVWGDAPLPDIGTN